MIKKSGSLLVAVVLLLAVEAGVYADPQFPVASPQGEITLGKFESDGDYFISTRNYTHMNFDKWFGAVSYKRFMTPNSANAKSYDVNLAQLGFATRIGELYIGVSYIGNAFTDFGAITSNSTIYSYTEETRAAPWGGKKNWRIFDRLPVLLYGNSNFIQNEAALLFGIADMGFKVYYVTDYQENSQSDFMSLSNNSYYKSYEEQAGHINPGIVWGMARELIPGRGIKPEIRVDLDFFRWNIKRDDYNSDGTTNGMYVLKSENVFIPGLNAVTGDFTLAEINDNTKLDVGLDYGMKLYLYDNEYSYMDDKGKYQIKNLPGGIAKGAGTSISTQFVGTNQVQHSLTPKISVRWSDDRLGLFAGLNLAMSVDNKTETQKDLKYDSMGSTDGSLIKAGTDDTTTVYSFAPAFNLAMHWAIVPERLFLNTGCEISIFKLGSTIVDKRMNVDNVEDKSLRYTQVNNSFGKAETTLYLGVTFNITENVGLQAALGVGGSNTVNVFDSQIRFGFKDKRASGGLFNMANILLTLKY